MDSPWQEPVRGGHPDSSLFALSGLEQLRAMLDGHVPQPPIGRLTGMTPTEVGAGSAAFAMPASGWLASPHGPLQIGVLAVLADGPLGCAVQTALPPGTPYTTSELSMRLLAPVRPGGELTARGSLIQSRRTIALSEVYVQDERGRLVAHGSSLCFLIVRDGDPPPPPKRLPKVETPSEESPDPYLRPPMGEVLPQEIWDRMSGLEVLRAQIAGDLPPPPLHHLTGIFPTAAEEGSATFTLPATEWLCAPPPGRVEGGVVGLLADSALASAMQTLLPAGTAYAPVDLKVNFLRPARTDGRDLTATGRVANAGRSILVADAEVVDADGKLVAIARGSALVRPGQPASLTAAPESLAAATDPVS
jgi:uncharacterized protein (TIGR00369 family)